MMHVKISSQGMVLLVVVLLVAIICIAYVNLRQIRDQIRIEAIIVNLRMIEGAKDQWAIDNKKQTGVTLTPKDLAPYMNRGISPPRPIIGEIYELNPVGTPAAAIIPIKLRFYAMGSKITAP